MDNLPIDILEDILDRLPADETALRGKQVCKTWRILLRHKTDKVGFLFTLSYPPSLGKKQNLVFYGDFIHGKLNYGGDAVYDMDDNEISIPGNSYIDGMLGSCNGLVCFKSQVYNRSVEPFLICNPLTGETVYVPYTYCAGNTQMSGFGYSHTTNEYKIVRMYWDRTTNDMRNYFSNKKPKKYHVQVYSFGGCGWIYKSVDFEKIARNKSICTCPVDSVGVYVNGAIHWLHQSIHAPSYYTIAAFDVEDETFEFIKMLEDVRYHPTPKLLGGSKLYFVSTIHYKPYHCTDIWAYNNTNTTSGGSCGYKDMNSWHWIKEFRIEWEERYWRDLKYVEPLAITRNNEFLFRCNGALYCYDLNTSTLYTLLDGRDLARSCMINVILHANTTAAPFHWRR